jgi:LexA-binding, inner membrane-associated putative hydrolase
MPLDIGVGILIALFVGHAYSVPVDTFLIFFGILCSLLPDIDILTLLFLKKWHHRAHTHFPLLYIPISLLVFFFFGSLYGTIFTLGVYAHLIHDTFGIGWGIAWFWPFSKRKYLCFPEQRRRKIIGTFVSWLPEEETVLMKNTQVTNGNWVRDFYFRPNLLAYIEYGVFFISILALIHYVF